MVLTLALMLVAVVVDELCCDSAVYSVLPVTSLLAHHDDDDDDDEAEASDWLNTQQHRTHSPRLGQSSNSTPQQLITEPLVMLTFSLHSYIFPCQHTWYGMVQ